MLLSAAVLAIAAGCGLLPPLPATIECGPLADTPAACSSAVDAALELLSLDRAEVAAIRVESPEPRACDPGALRGCRTADVVVLAWPRGLEIEPQEAPLIGAGEGWVSLYQVR